jgi:AcrR family transcriptional regulator
VRSIVNAMQQAETRPAPDAGLAHLPPRERILAAARELFYRHGIRAVGVDAIAEAAGTNKMTLYRHFASKDELVAACLVQVAAEDEARWQALAAAHPDAKGQLLGWLTQLREKMMVVGERGCPFANAAVELPDKDHPARRIIEAHKLRRRDSIVELCRTGGLSEPERLADEIFLLIEGANVCLQSMGPSGPAQHFVSMAQALIADHETRGRR